MAWTEVAVRPDGRLYRARKRPISVGYGDDHHYGVVVLRTHDIDIATALAYWRWRHLYDTRDPLPAAMAGWTKLVPWDWSGYGDSSFIGQAGFEKGSVPCVWFHRDDYPLLAFFTRREVSE